MTAIQHASQRLEIKGIRKRFASVTALSDVSLTIEPGEFFCLLGPSGCGKTTLLNVIGGLVESDVGSVLLGARDVTHVAMQRRDIGIVFQSYALFPHMTVRGNISFGMEVRGRSKADIAKRVDALLQLTRLDGKAERLPRQLSGGEQQRVSLARALAVDPGLLLLDEPFSNLDAKLRVDLRSEMRRVQRETGITTLLVTHDQDEAFALGDRVGLMQSGALVQVGSPQELYANPRSEFTARFVGESNILAGPVETQEEVSGLRCGGEFIPVRGIGQRRTAKVMVRPEHIVLQRERPVHGLALTGVVRAVSYKGIGWRYEVDSDVGRLIAVHLTRHQMADVGSDVHVGWDVADVVVLPAEGEE